MDFKMTVDNVSGGFSVGRQVDWCDPNNPEIVYASRYKSSNDDMERAFYPSGFQGNGTMGATQELVDAFGMADGYPSRPSTPTIPRIPTSTGTRAFTA